MSDRGNAIQGAQTAPEGQSTLGELSASRDLHKTKTSKLDTQAANQADLTSASLSSSAQVVRVPHRPELRRDLSPQSGPAAERSLNASSQTGKGAGASVKPAHGIFTNPAYKYSGGLASKIISFIANILKVLERLLLRLLTGPDRSAPAPTQQSHSATPNQKEANTPDESKLEREKRERAQTIARS